MSEKVISVPDAPVEQATHSIEDSAAADFMRLLPIFHKKVEELSNKQTKRVLTALMEYPLERDNINLEYKEEKEAFNMGMQIMDCKFVIMKAVFELTQNKEAMEAFKKESEGEKKV